ncbi:MAG: hypothetical protein ABIY55_03455 [Kofleriaceae bacterium]
MRTLFSLSFVLAGACAADAPTVPPTDFLVPTARASSLDGFDFAELVGATPSCMTRYDIAGLPPGVECHTALIDGNARHYVTTCPAVHASLATTHELELDAADRLIHDVAVYPDVAGQSSRPGSYATTYHYDAQGRLAAMETESTRDGMPGRMVAFGEPDASGNASSAAVTSDPLVLDQVYPSTAHSQWALDYDASDRLIGFQARFAPSGNLYFDEAITYDDHARRRELSLKTDLSAEIPIFAPNLNPPTRQYDLFDHDGRIIERRAIQPSAGHDWAVRFRYDEQHRLLTTVSDSADYHYTAREIYDCP